VRAVILAAKGKSFSAGADLAWMKRMAGNNYEENLLDARVMANMLRCLHELPKPTIARVQGPAYGGGVGLVSCCDMAVAVPEAIFSFSEVRLGLVPATIAPYVIAAIGPRAAKRYFQTAEPFSAETAQTLGLLTAIVDADALDEAIDSLLSAILSNGPIAVSLAKQLVNEIGVGPITDDRVEKSCEMIASIRVSAEGQEGMAAFLEKRKPNWNKTGKK